MITNGHRHSHQVCRIWCTSFRKDFRLHRGPNLCSHKWTHTTDCGSVIRAAPLRSPTARQFVLYQLTSLFSDSTPARPSSSRCASPPPIYAPLTPPFYSPHTTMQPYPPHTFVHSRTQPSISPYLNNTLLPYYIPTSFTPQCVHTRLLSPYRHAVIPSHIPSCLHESKPLYGIHTFQYLTGL